MNKSFFIYLFFIHFCFAQYGQQQPSSGYGGGSSFGAQRPSPSGYGGGGGFPGMFPAPGSNGYGGNQHMQMNSFGGMHGGYGMGMGTGMQGGLPSVGGYGGGGSFPTPAPAVSQCSITTEQQACFSSHPNCAIARALPFERRSPVMCEECVTLCTQRMAATEKYRCFTAVYDYTFMTCDLFAVAGNRYTYPLVIYNNRDLFTVNPTCNMNATAVTTVAGQTTTVAGQTTQTTTVAADTTTTVINAAVSSCGTGEEARYLGVRDSIQAGADDQTLPSASLPECAEACTNNLLPDGTQFMCISFDYGPGNQCALSGSAVAPTGTGTLEPQTGAGYFEKICVLSSAVSNCGPIFERYPGQILVGFARTAVMAPNFDACLNACLQASEFVCSSGQYFPPSGAPDDENCVLNTETKDNNPDLFTPTDEPTDYFQLDCGRRSVIRRLKPTNAGVHQKDDFAASPFFKSKTEMREKLLKSHKAASLFGQWTDWSNCNLVDATRNRYRRCDSLDIRKCPKQIDRCPLHDAAIIGVANLPQKPLSNRGSVGADPQVTVTTVAPPQSTTTDDIDTRCLCMKNNLGRRCDIGTRQVRRNGVVTEEYCNSPEDINV